MRLTKVRVRKEQKPEDPVRPRQPFIPFRAARRISGLRCIVGVKVLLTLRCKMYQLEAKLVAEHELEIWSAINTDRRDEMSRVPLGLGTQSSS